MILYDIIGADNKDCLKKFLVAFYHVICRSGKMHILDKFEDPKILWVYFFEIKVP